MKLSKDIRKWALGQKSAPEVVRDNAQLPPLEAEIESQALARGVSANDHDVIQVFSAFIKEAGPAPEIKDDPK